MERLFLLDLTCLIKPWIGLPPETDSPHIQPERLQFGGSPCLFGGGQATAMFE
jgi:hypothetical protein